MACCCVRIRCRCGVFERILPDRTAGSIRTRRRWPACLWTWAFLRFARRFAFRPTRSLRRRLSSGPRHRTSLANLTLAQAPGAAGDAALIRVRPAGIDLARAFAGRAIDYLPIAIAGAGAAARIPVATTAWPGAGAVGACTGRRVSVVWAHCELPAALYPFVRVWVIGSAPLAISQLRRAVRFDIPSLTGLRRHPIR